MNDKIQTGQNKQKKIYQGSAQNKKHFKEPKLKFIKPKLTKQGSVTNITSFVGSLQDNSETNGGP